MQQKDTWHIDDNYFGTFTSNSTLSLRNNGNRSFLIILWQTAFYSNGKLFNFVFCFLCNGSFFWRFWQRSCWFLNKSWNCLAALLANPNCKLFQSTRKGQTKPRRHLQNSQEASLSSRLHTHLVYELGRDAANNFNYLLTVFYIIFLRKKSTVFCCKQLNVKANCCYRFDSAISVL